MDWDGPAVSRFILALSYGIPLTLGVIGHEGSTVLVCLNGLRLLRPPKNSRYICTSAHRK